MCPPVFTLYQHHVPAGVALEAAELALEISLAVDLLAHHHLRPASGEAFVVFCARQRTIQARRRHLEGVLPGYHVVHVENRAQIAADLRAFLDGHAVFGRAARSRPVEPDSQHHAGRLAPELDVEDVEPVRRGDACRDGVYPAHNVCHKRALNEKERAYRPLWSY